MTALVARVRTWDVLRASAAYFAVWFVANGVLAFTVLGAGYGEEFPIEGNWAHGILHMATGIVGLAVASANRGVREFLLALVVVYGAAAVTGAVSGHEALGFATVDTFGTIVHGAEAALVIALLLVAPPPSADGPVPG